MDAIQLGARLLLSFFTIMRPPPERSVHSPMLEPKTFGLG